MKQLGQSLAKGAVLILGFLVLIFVLSSLPGGQPGPAAPQEPAVQSQAQPSVPASTPRRVPSAVREAHLTPAPATASPATAGQAQPTGSRLNRPQPTETDAEMHRRISSFLDRNE